MFSFNCFDFAFQYLYWLLLEGMMEDFERYHKEIIPLVEDLEVVRFFVSYVRLQSNGFFADNDEEEDIDTGGDNNPHFILPIIEDVVSKIPTDIHSAYLTSGSDAAFIEVKRCRDDIKFFVTLINQMRISLLPNCKGYCSLQHHHRLIDVFRSLGNCLENNFFTMSRTEFIESVIGFTTVQGVDRTLLIDFLTQLELAAGYAVSMFYASRFDTDRCESLQMHMPAIADYPQLREAYIRILKASKLSQASTHIFSPQKKNKKEEEKKQQQQEEEDGLEVAQKFIDSLLEILEDLCFSHEPPDSDRIVPSVKDQLQKLDRGLRLLSILFVEKHKEFTSLADELKDLIGDVVIDAAILICSLSPKELKKGLTKESDLALSHWHRVVECIISEAVQFHPPASSSSTSSFSNTNELGYIDFLSLLQHLEQLVSTEDDSIAFLKDQFHRVKDDLASLKPFLEKIAEQRYQNSELQTLWDSVMGVAHRVELAIDSIIYQVIIDKPDCPLMSLGTITKEIDYLKTKVLESMRNADILDQPDQRVSKTPSRMSSQVSASGPKFNEFLVGLHEEQNKIIEKLTRGSNKLEIFSIVGMPGIGKTTLANKVYKDPSIMYHFHFRAWCTVSEAYSKQDMLLQIMGDVSKTDEMLYKHLKGKRYLIVLDDVWLVDAFNLLQQSFPDDNNGSRLLITSRYHKLCPRFNDHHLPLLTDKDSWDLLHTKVFGEERCPPALEILGKQIAKHCKGLPLTVMIVAGVLAANYEEKNCWEDIAKSLSTFTGIQEQCKETLEFSYKNLPDHLKPCLLYFGAFGEDQNISVQILLRLWISEGFVQDNEAKSLEEVADEYLMNLISRSLVMVAKSRSSGGVKTCRVHDLLYEFCVRKAKEESFLQILHGWNELLDSTTLYEPRRLSLHRKENEWSIYFPHLRFHHLRSLFLFSDEFVLVLGNSILFQNFKLLRVLDIRTIRPIANIFSEGVELLVQLRYLAFTYGSWLSIPSIPSGIADLTCLETFLIETTWQSVKGIKLPNTIWKMKKLRHVNCEDGFIFPTDNLKNAPDLHNLRTCTLCVDDFSSESFHHLVMKFPNISRLKCKISMTRKTIENFQGLDSLKTLESLGMDRFSPLEFGFPSHLQKLTLKFCKRKWSEISAIGKLPNLQVLKLLCDSFVGKTWEVKEGEFPELKFLKLENLDIRKWTFADDDFPRLETLVLRSCAELEEVPQCLGDIPTLKLIEVKNICRAAKRSVQQIQEEHIANGNEYLNFIFS